MEANLKCLRDLNAAGAVVDYNLTELIADLKKQGTDINKEDTLRPKLFFISSCRGQVDSESDNNGHRVEKNSKKSALNFACHESFSECMKELLKDGSEVNITDSDGNTALAGHDEYVKELKDLAEGTDMKSINENKTTPLVLAAEDGNTEYLKKLIAAGADINKDGRTALMIAAHTGHVECLKELIAAGAYINRQTYDGLTALWTAANQGRVECLKELISAEADINKEDKDGQTALNIAANTGHVECLKELIAAGTDINKEDKDDQTALKFAANHMDIESLKQLIAAGADLNTVDVVGMEGTSNECIFPLTKDEGKDICPTDTSLTYAAGRGKLSCVKELITAGADVNTAYECHGNGPLLSAAINKEEKDSKTAFNITDDKKLIGTDANIRTVIELLMHAVENGKAETVEELLKYGADVNTTDKFGNTTLMTSVKVGSQPIFQLLVSHGANVNTENDKGETALSLAVSQNHVEYERVQSNGQKMQKHILNEEFSLEGSSLMVYMLLRKGAHLHETKSGLNPCTIHLTSAEFKNPNPMVLKLLDAGGAKENMKEFSPVKPLQGCAQNFIKEHLKQIHLERNLYFIARQLGLQKRLQSSLLLNAVQKHNLFPNSKEKEFLKKIKENDRENVEHWINDGVDVNVQDENDMTPLMIASQAGHTELVEQLSKAEASMNIRSTFGDTALMYAARRMNCVKKHLEFGANVNIHKRKPILSAKYSQNVVRKNSRKSIKRIHHENNLDAFILHLRLPHNSAELDENLQDSSRKSIRERLKITHPEKGLYATLPPLGLPHRMQTNLLFYTHQKALASLKNDEKEFLLGKSQRNTESDLSKQTNVHVDKNGTTALIIVSDVGHTNLAEDVIEAEGIENTVQNLNGSGVYTNNEHRRNTPVKSGKTLIQYGADLNISEKDKMTKFEISSENISFQLIKGEVENNLAAKTEIEVKSDAKAGGNLDFAQKPEDIETLKAAFELFGSKYPPKLSTLCEQNSNEEMLSVIPLPSSCPMTTTRKGRRYLVTVVRGEATSLQGNRSDVKLEINKGCPRTAYLMEVRTDLSNFGSVIPDNECFISPIVEVLAPAETSISSHVLHIPHCLDKDDDRTKVKVRLVHENRVPAVVEVPKGNAGALYYDIDDRFIRLHTTHFCQVICSICQEPTHCFDRVTTLCFAKFEQTTNWRWIIPKNPIHYEVEIRPYFCSVLGNIKDFIEQLEKTLRMECVGRGHLKIPRNECRSESGLLKFSLKVPDPAWRPIEELQTWNAASRIYVEANQLLNKFHICRTKPIEGAVYRLRAEGKTHFRADFKAKLTIHNRNRPVARVHLPLNFAEEKIRWHAGSISTDPQNNRGKSEFPQQISVQTQDKQVFQVQESKSHLRLSTLCQALTPKEMKDIFPSSSLCSMTTTRDGRRYLGTIPRGKATTLQGDKSDVKLEIKEGCPKKLHLMTVRADMSSFETFIRDDECFISPIVEVLVLPPAETSTTSYILRIPHCLDEDDDRSKVNVRMIGNSTNQTVTEVPERKKCTDGSLFFDIDRNFIELHTTHFTKVICTICQKPYHCRGKIQILWYAECQTHHRNASFVQTLFRLIRGPELHHEVEIRPYFCGKLQTMYDIKKDTHLIFQTKGCINISIDDSNLESDQLHISLKVREPGWQPTQRLDEWKEETRTFSKKIPLVAILETINGHQCRDTDLRDAIIYNMEGQNLTVFKGTGTIELISDDNVSLQQQHLLRQVEMPIIIDVSGSRKRKREVDDIDDEDDDQPPAKRSAGSRDQGEKVVLLRRREMYVDLKMNQVEFDQLPPDIDDREIARLAPLFGPYTLETVALQHFGISQAKVSQYNKDRRDDGEGVKRDLLTYYRNTGHKRKDLYRVLLISELEGILDSADMVKVENLLLNPPGSSNGPV